MVESNIILNEREARDVRSRKAKLEQSLATEATFEPFIKGLPPQVVNGYWKALKAHKEQLEAQVAAYDAAKQGNYSSLLDRASTNSGVSLIVARIARGLTQKELARRLGLKEQQIQRYEADRYNSISHSNFERVASALGAKVELKLSDWIGSGWNLASEITAKDVKKIVKHAREHAWFKPNDFLDNSEDEGENYLQTYVSDQVTKYGSPSLLRTGLNVENHSDDLSLVAWKARVTRIAENKITKSKTRYFPGEISWLLQLVSLSVHDDGPLQAVEFLTSKGIIVVVEPQIPGMKIDGAAFVVKSTPVIGLTLRRDTVDSFWFTLLHEVAHVILHFHSGLATGFFDDNDNVDVDKMEEEANDFASNMLISDEIWSQSPARIAKSGEVIEKFAKSRGIHPAVVFGRIQKERKNYKVFAGEIGRGLVRKLFLKGNTKHD